MWHKRISNRRWEGPNLEMQGPILTGVPVDHRANRDPGALN